MRECGRRDERYTSVYTRGLGVVVVCVMRACGDVQELAHLLQGMESKLLHIVIEKYQDYILLLQHDGFVLSRYVDPREIEAEISYQTGIEMPLTYQKLSLYQKALECINIRGK